MMNTGLSMYRVYGHAGNEFFDEYCEAVNAQKFESFERLEVNRF